MSNHSVWQKQFKSQQMEKKRIKQEKKEYDKWLNETIISGIICGECGKTLPDILAKHHLDINCPTNQCPHPPSVIYVYN